MSSIQGSVNQLLGIGAAVTTMGVKSSQANYAAKRGAEYDKSYQANLEAAKVGTTKSGAVSKSKKAIEAQEAAKAAAPQESKVPYWNKGIEESLKAGYDKKMSGLQSTVDKGRADLAKAAMKGKQETAQQFGGYQDIAGELMSKMSSADRWKVRAQQRLIQKDAFDKFLSNIDKEGNK